MKNHGHIIINILLLLWSISSMAQQQCTGTDYPYVSPTQLYGRLLTEVMDIDSLFGQNKLFVESKTFVDVVPQRNINDILADWCRHNGNDIEGFLKSNFVIPEPYERKSMERHKDIHTYIKDMWKFLTRPTDSIEHGTRIMMKHPYFVPGGRFREMYYWDSYFSMIGMLCDNEHELVMNLIENFADCIHQLGFIPNGMRTYYLGRSQPPFFSYIVSDAARYYGDSIIVRYLPELVNEHRFWMLGSDSLSVSCTSCLHTVMMPDGEILNRYYDKFDTPREEAWRNDLDTERKLKATHPDINSSRLFRDLRAAAESGFDFSSRWMTDGRNLYTARTTDIVPVDLNSLMCHLESTIAKGYSLKGERKIAAQWTEKAKARAKAIRKYFWSSKENWYCDYVLSAKTFSPYLSLAGMYPLYESLATKGQAKAAEKTFTKTFLKPGGALTTPYETGEQWDAPNGWAPLEWISYQGLQNYNLNTTATKLRDRWMATCWKMFEKTGTLKEKYNVMTQDDTSGGEYVNQTGFGWTNGVFRAMEETINN
ncbi:alpha,alpha-trehalase [Bacteroidales bacterium KA00344]|nr:alpha,alpha-trehalase [Bacteroidales bacterium KA00344]